MNFINNLGNIFVFCCIIYHNLEFTFSKYIYNLAYCQSKNHKEFWLLITNGRPKMAKVFYSYRIGDIEFIFKLQKTNGFYLEETRVLNYHAFDNLYSLVCLANLYLTCLGTDISKNRSCYKNIGFRDTRINSKINNYYRIKSRFRSSLILFTLMKVYFFSMFIFLLFFKNRPN